MRGAQSPEAGWCGEAVAEHRPDGHRAERVWGAPEAGAQDDGVCRWTVEAAGNARSALWGAPEALSMVSRGLQPRSGCYPR